MRVWSWGSGSDGQLGHGDNKDIKTPKIIDALFHLKPKCIAGGGSHTLLVRKFHYNLLKTQAY